MDPETEPFEELEQSLADGIAAVMAAGEDLEEPADLADLYLEELNRLWANPPEARMFLA